MITKRMFSKGSSNIGITIFMAALIFILGFIALAPPWAHAQIPRYINYQGKLLDSEDNPVTDELSITVRIYDAQTGGTALWEETQTVTVTRGIFSMLLGNTTALDSLDFNSAYWYSVEVASDGEMTPRQRLTAVAYAINADKLDGYDASSFLQVDTTEGTTTGITVSGGLITAGANEDIEMNPTGTGNVIITIDSSSGDFKITDGTTNYVLVDNETGNVTIASDLTVNGTIYGDIASTGGDSTFSSITVTGASDLQGKVDVGGNADITGNLDVTGNSDVTGTLGVTGATTLSSSLDMNSNIDLDYSGTSAALDVAQASTGAAAEFTGGKVIIGADTANAYALSAGELYVQGDLEVDGKIYGDISSSGSTTLGDTTLGTLAVTGNSDLQGNLDIGAGIDITGAANFAGGTTYNIDSTGAATFKTLDITQTDSSTSGTATTAIVQPTYQDAGGDSTTAAVAMNIAPTINYTGSSKTGSYTALKIASTETSLPDGTNYLIDAYAGADGTTQRFYVDNSGNTKIFGTLNMNSNKITNLANPVVAQDAVTKAYADAITPATAGGWTDGGTGVYLLTQTDNVGVGTTSTGTYKLNVAGATNTTSLYINGLPIASTDLSDSASLAMLAQDETITGNWVNTTHPWADDEVANDLTISGGTIDNSVIGGTTPAAGTFTTLTANTSLSVTGDTEIDTTGAAALASITQTDGSAALAIATDTTKANGGVGADSDGVLKLGINDGNYQYLWYDANAGTDTNGAFVFSDQAVIPTASPAYLNFGMDFNATTKKFDKYYAMKFDPDVGGKQKFSVVNIPNPGPDFADTEEPLFDVASDGSFNIYDPSTGDAVFQIASGGKMAHDFRNLIKNGSFEAFSIFESFHAADPTANTTTGGSGYKYEGGWDNFAPDEWIWKNGYVFQYAPKIFAGNATIVDRTTEVLEGKSALAIKDPDTAASDFYPLTGTETTYNDGHIQQTIKNLKPNTWYSIGVAIMVEDATYCRGIVDITGEYNPTANLTTAIAATGTPSTIVVNSTANFPDAGTLLIGQELFNYIKKTSTEFKNITRGVNSTTAAVHPTGTDNVKGVFRPIISSTTTYQTSKGIFKTDSQASDIVVHLISQSTDTASPPVYTEVRFDTVQLVAGKMVPEFTPSSITDTGDQTIYGTLRMGRTADGRGGILAVDQFVRTRGVELFIEDPGFTGTAGGIGGIEPATASGSNAGSVSLTTSGEYYGVDPCDFRVWISSAGTPDEFSWEYMTLTPDAASSWVTGGANIAIDSTWSDAATPKELINGVKIYFSGTTGGVVNDEWRFSAFGVDPHAAYDSFSGAASYEHSQSRIFKDPGSKKLTFMDAGKKVTLDQVAALVGEPAFVEEPYYVPPAGVAGGSLWCTTAGSNYTGSDQRFYQIEIDGEGGATTADTFRWSNGIGTPYWDGENIPITGSVQVLESGVQIKFMDSYSGYFNEAVLGDQWSFKAYPVVAGTMSFGGTGATSFTIGNNSTIDPQDIALNFYDYDSTTSTGADRFIKWDDGINKFVISNDMNISGTLSATNLSGTVSADDLPVAAAGIAGIIPATGLTDAMVSAAAAIKTFKLSGPVTSIANNGLGALATLDAVSGGTGGTITDATITDADIAANAAVAGTKISPDFGSQDILTSGNVGIGTTVPEVKLDVVGGAIRTNNQLISTVATGTAPLLVSSTTAVTNLNADMLDGQHGSYYMPASTDNWVNTTGDTMTGPLTLTYDKQGEVITLTKTATTADLDNITEYDLDVSRKLTKPASGSATWAGAVARIQNYANVAGAGALTDNTAVLELNQASTGNTLVLESGGTPVVTFARTGDITLGTGADTITSAGDLVAKLGDAAGTNKLSVRSSTNLEKFAVFSDGTVQIAGGYSGTAGGGITLLPNGDIKFDGDMYQTGNKYEVSTIRYTGNYNVGEIAKFGVGASGNETDYLRIGPDGHILDNDDPVTIADDLTQTGSGNIVTFQGNVNAQNGLDVTGAALTAANGLTVSGGVSLPSNSIIDSMVSDTLTASNLVAPSSVVSDAEVDNDITIASSKAGSFAGLTTTALTATGDITGSASKLDIDKSYTNPLTGILNDHTLTRNITLDDGSTSTVTGSVLTINSVNTQTSGTLTDNSTLLKLQTGANAGAGGYFIDGQDSTGVSKFKVSAAGAGTFADDLTVGGDLNVTGSQIITGTTHYQGAQTITATSPTAFLVEKDTGEDTFIVNTTDQLVGINKTPAPGVELDVAGDADFSGTLTSGTDDAFQVSHTGGITSVGLNAGTGLITTSGNIQTTAGVMTSAGLLTASAGVNVSGGNIAITDSSNIVLNANKITFYGATGNATMAGVLTQLSTIGLTPDYDSASLRGDGSDNFGTLSLLYGSSHNYYEWTTNEPTTQDYDIVVRYRLPDGFTSFDISTPIKLWNILSAAPNAATVVKVQLLDTDGFSILPISSTTGTYASNWLTLNQNTSWTETTITIDNSATELTSLDAGKYITLIIKLCAYQGDTVDVGELSMKGNW